MMTKCLLGYVQSQKLCRSSSAVMSAEQGADGETRVRLLGSVNQAVPEFDVTTHTVQPLHAAEPPQPELSVVARAQNQQRW